jgi:hypothetical protein
LQIYSLQLKSGEMQHWYRYTLLYFTFSRTLRL